MLVTHHDSLFATRALRPRRREYARSAFRFATMFASTGLYGAWLGLVSAWRGVDPTRSARLTQHWSRRLLRGLGIRVQVFGTRDDSAAILVANHRSYIDIPLVAATRPVAFLAKSEISRWPVIGTCARVAGTVFVRRGDTDSQREARETLQQRASRGEAVALFPEGTTFAGPGHLPLRRGIFHSAVSAEVAVAPVALVYQHRDLAYVDDHSFVPHFLDVMRRRRQRAFVSFGPAMRGDCPYELHERVTAWMTRETARLERLATAEAA